MTIPTSAQREDGKRRKERILDAAEIVFSKEGFSGASMRQILSLAGANVAAGRYYFGTKEALYQAVIARYMQPLNEERLVALSELDLKTGTSKTRNEGLQNIIRIYIAPHLRLANSKSGQHYGNLIARFLVERADVIKPIYVEHIFPLRAKFSEAFKVIYPEISDAVLRRSFELIALTMAGVANNSDQSRKSARETSRLIDDVVLYLTGGITALIHQDASMQPVV